MRTITFIGNGNMALSIAKGLKENYKIEVVGRSLEKLNKFEKDLIKIDRRVGLLYSAIGGGILRIYPIPNDENNKWV